MKHSNASANLSFRIGIPDPYALRLGHFTSRWGSIEFALEGVIWDLAGLRPEVGHVFTRCLQARQKQDQIRSLLEVVAVPPEVRACWERADDHIERLVPTVNALVHGHWAADAKPRPAHEHPIGRPDLDWRGAMAVQASATYTLQDLDEKITKADNILSVLTELADRLRSCL